MDPDSLFFWIRIQIQHLSESGSGRGSGFGSRVFMTKTWKITAWNFVNIFFLSKIAISLSKGRDKARPSYRKSLQALKKEHPSLQKMKFSSWPFLPSWIRTTTLVTLGSDFFFSDHLWIRKVIWNIGGGGVNFFLQNGVSWIFPSTYR